MDATERRERATDEATQWWSRLGARAADEVTAADREQFTQWLRESPLHVAEFLHVAHVHDTLKRFSHWNEVALDPGPQEAEIVPLPADAAARPRPQVARNRKRPWLAAAVVACAAVAAGWLSFDWGGQTLRTQRAERREVMLNDGSVVQLEPESVVRVELGERERRITLSRGRALFHVAKDSLRPFLVRADNTMVQAIGTAFGVERREGSVVVTVSEGRVAVTPALRVAQDAPAVAAEDSRSLLLTAGKQVTVPRSGSVRVVAEVDADRALAWAEGRLVFDSTPLSEVAAEFNRYNHVQLRVEGDDLARRPVSGVFRASDPETFLAFVATGARVSIDREEGRSIVISSVPAPEK